MNNPTLATLREQCYAKHGRDWANALALGGQYGNARHKATWVAILDLPERSPVEVVEHQIWPQGIQQWFKEKRKQESNNG